MAMSTTFANNVLKLLFNATTFANVAINASSSPITNTYIALHSAQPATNFQDSNELTYTSYARQAVLRDNTGWTVSSNTATLAANVNFPTSTGGTPTATYASIGKTVSGNTDLWIYGTVSPNIVISTTGQSTLTTNSAVTFT